MKKHLFDLQIIQMIHNRVCLSSFSSACVCTSACVCVCVCLSSQRHVNDSLSVKEMSLSG